MMMYNGGRGDESGVANREVHEVPGAVDSAHPESGQVSAVRGAFRRGLGQASEEAAHSRGGVTMPRKRDIKHEFFKDEEVASMSPLARLLFIGLWTIADRDGRLEDRPVRIKAELLPYDDCDVEALLGEMAEPSRAFIVRYQAGGRRYLAVRSFARHQSPHPKETPSVIVDYRDVIESNGNAAASNGSAAASNGKAGASNPFPSYSSTPLLLNPSTPLPAPSGALSPDQQQLPQSAFQTQAVEDPPARTRTRAKADAAPVMPEALDTAEFRAAWEAWTADRRERRKPLTERGADMQLRKLAEWGSARAVAAIEHSIANGYQGIFEARPERGGGKTRDDKAADVLMGWAAKQEAREARRG